MVCGAGHGYDEQRLDQHGDAEGVHGEAGRVDFEAEDVNDTLSLLWVVWLEQGCKAGRRGCSRRRGLARRGVIMDENAILTGELLEGDRYEGANTAYYKDLGGLARRPLVVVVLLWELV